MAVCRPVLTPLLVGTAGHGVFSAALVSSSKVLPVVLDVVGGTGARFRTSAAIGNRGPSGDVVITFMPAPGFGEPALSAGP